MQDGRIVAAAQEERFTRKKHDAGFPTHAVESCLRSSGLTINDIHTVAFYDKPFLKFERLLETYLNHAPKGILSFWKAMPVWLKEKLWIGDSIKKELGFTGTILYPEHHESHAASAFFPSPFEDAAFLTMDGVGEWATTSWGVGEGNSVKILAEQHFPHSLGLLYSAFTYLTGFRVNSGEYKVMGLAPYGEPKYVQVILDNLIEVKDDGSYQLNMDYFNYETGLTMTGSKMHTLFDRPPRKPESSITQMDMDLARSVQEVTEDVMMKTVRHIQKTTGKKHLCMAGGVALNCVSNGKILRSGQFDSIWIQPAAGDAGGALGAALMAYHGYLNNERSTVYPDNQHGSYLGEEYSMESIESFLTTHNIPHTSIENASDTGAEIIENGKVLGWYQGRMEFGPRALGNRSILGDARSEKMQRTMNLKIKYRESFRPFAPSVMEEDISDWFDIDRPSPYMLLVADVLKKHQLGDFHSQKTGLDKLNEKRSSIPAVTHVDFSARIQSVSKESNPKYHALISAFKKRTGCPVIVNTSFNVRGEPIVESPGDAYKCFMRTEMDYLILGDFLLDKKEQPEWIDTINWRQTYALD